MSTPSKENPIKVVLSIAWRILTPALLGAWILYDRNGFEGYLLLLIASVEIVRYLLAEKSLSPQ